MKPSTEAREDYIARTKQARLSVEKTHQEVADAIGIDRPTYTNYESRRAMPQKYIAKFCAFTKVSEKWLLTGEGPMKSEERTGVTETEAKILDKIRSLDDEVRQALEIMIGLNKKS